MHAPERISDETLLDYLLERCDQAEAARVAGAVEHDAVVAARLAALRRILEPLDTWTAPPPPARLVDDILDAIAAQSAGEAIKRERAASAVPSGSDRDYGGRPLLSLRELLALAACITILVGIIVPSASSAKFNARRQMCASNLGSLYQATTAYAQANAGFLPAVARAPDQAWLPKPGKTHQTNRRPVYLLLKGRYVSDPATFVCPARLGDSAVAEQDVSNNNDFPDKGNCGYDAQLLAGPTPRRLGVAARVSMAYLSDTNPLFDGGKFNPEVDPATANSTSHREFGQNVLRLDGRVSWCTSPEFEPTGDNIWQAGDAREYDGTERPVAITDAFLIP